MPPLRSEKALAAIERAVMPYKEGANLGEIARALPANLPRRTLQSHLRYLVENQRLLQTGRGPRWIRYIHPATSPQKPLTPQSRDTSPAALKAQALITLSHGGQEILTYVSQPLAARKPIGYQRQFLDSYRPNVTFYLSSDQRAHLAKIGQPPFSNQVAGTYAREILNRLLIDLSWNSSRLEGNTYSLLDTKRLIELGQENAAKDQREAQMILNHKQAIEFLVSQADEVEFNRYTVLNLHGILAQNLLRDIAAAGRLRRIPVAIEGSVFRPLEVPQLIDECLNQLLKAAAEITDPFEQAFFAMVQLPYLQPFDDVNKRVSRLAANIPFIRQNLSPLSFTDMPVDLYTKAILGVYELNRVDLLRDVFIWAYERSADIYAAVRQSLGEPDPFRFKYRTALQQAVADVVRGPMNQRAAAEHIQAWGERNIPDVDRARFRASAEAEVLSLHEGNFARYQVRPSEFGTWQKIWNDHHADPAPEEE